MEILEYKGNKFALEEIYDWNRVIQKYSISVEEINCGDVYLPESHAGKKITEWIDHKAPRDFYYNRKYYSDSCKKSENYPRYPVAKVLHIPASIGKIDIDNDLFPELELVEIDADNMKYSTDGRLIIMNEGMRLINCPVCKEQSMVIPECVRSIGDYAFFGTKYRKILFTGKDLKIEPRAFDGSGWLALQGDVVVIGNVLYKISEGIDRLVVPEQVKKFYPTLFSWKNCPRELVTPIMPGRADIDSINETGKCHYLELTSNKLSVNMTWLRRWTSLRGVQIAEGHKRYRTVDGVVYSVKGDVLVWYPGGKPEETFTVPEGVQKIGEFAFANQTCLKRIILPESVRTLGTGAFFNCSHLEQVQLSSGIREIPDAGAYQGKGAFSECPNLKNIALPAKMTYVGSFAFYKSGLESINLGESLEQIGEYALMAPGLEWVSLPSTVKRVGKGSLFYAEEIRAYEGTAKGIIAAVNACWPYMKENSQTLEWSGFRIEVLHKKSDKRDYFLVPESLKRNAAYHLENAWNGDKIDYDEYDECLEAIKDSDEKLEFAQYGLQRQSSGEDNVYEDYIRKVSLKLGYCLLEEGGEKEFLSLLKRNFFSENALQKLLKYSNEQGRTVCSAYLTNALRKKRGNRKSGGFRI